MLYKSLFLVVRAPKNSKIKGRFLLGAEIEFNVGKWLRIALSRRKDKTVDTTYDFLNFNTSLVESLKNQNQKKKNNSLFWYKVSGHR